MKISRWYKEFGDDRVLTFYHIVDLDEDKGVSGLRYKYNPLIRKVVSKEECILDPKWWMEQEIQNNVYAVPENTVPFLIKF
ncbi:MAG: hypothetical protein JXB03_08145 [Spirochaetales bacterium]|nr:hypothetical protein [Spirochaetales bacterium]